ncbi:RNA polymerase sigma factor [Aromatoleum petrolei]|uniref:RNA polymerase sigma factor n=1 Tax=Aromatoleum petrolei TaxID=76116 RepID=A0ABX1MQL2_9RHOO|nr:RNA polymerase sigma factor [Aromatoleum petrolei]NMF88284.1 RNA polymerase sigma factor [Aromatoleum petrolei]QTQ38019.1 ECF RNA polymerase sigma-E factor [Aromatoleum petrolei]
MTIAARAGSSSEPDSALVERILAGDPFAFERMMRRHNRRLFRVARSILRDDAEAEDAVQDSYIEAHRALRGFRGESRLSTWLTRIVVNRALAQRRARHPGEHTETDPDTLVDSGNAETLQTPETQAMRAELRRIIEASIDHLPEAHRTVFMLRAVEGLSVDETAAALGISAGNTKVRFLRARAHLRETLGQHIGTLLEDVFSFDGERCDRIVAHVCARLGLTLSAPPTLPAQDAPPLSHRH